MEQNPIVNWAAQQGFLPHGYCYQWSSNLLTLMVASDVIIALAYYSIPLALLVFLDKRKDIKFSWVFVLFASFIFACGTTHVMDIITIWYPAYWLQGWVKAGTAFVSALTALLLWPIVTRASEVLVPLATNDEIKALRDQVEYLKAELAKK